MLALSASAVASTTIFRYVGRQPELKIRVPEFTALMLLAGVLYVIAVFIVEWVPLPGAAMVIILSAAFAYRLAVLPVEPQLSDDLYRYQWEGRIQRAGVNPYTVYPAMPQLKPFEDPGHPLTAGQYTPTVYPPLSEKAFSWVRTVSAYKRLFTALDVASVGTLLLILAALDQPRQRILVYAWNPTVVVSFAMCGHHDSLAIVTLLAATLLIIARRPAASAAFLALSVLSKFFAFMLLPLFYGMLPRQKGRGARVSAVQATVEVESYNSGWRLTRRLSPWLVFTVIWSTTILLGYVPYLRAGRHIFGGLGNYAAVWEANDSLFRLVRWAGNSQSQSELIAGVALLGLLFWVMRGYSGKAGYMNRNVRPQFEGASRDGSPGCDLHLLYGALVITAGLLLLSPTAFPWYFTWSIPFLCFYPSAPWLLMSITAVLGYAPVVGYAAGQPYLHSPLILTLEYGPVLAWLACLAIRRLLRISSQRTM